jgi:hypothetical protein
VNREYVGIDLHRRRSVIYRMDAAGKKLDCVRIDNEPLRLVEEVSKAGPGAEVVVEATYGWYWAVDLLRELGVGVHLGNQLDSRHDSSPFSWETTIRPPEEQRTKCRSACSGRCGASAFGAPIWATSLREGH